jgi:hypothetical protein
MTLGESERGRVRQKTYEDEHENGVDAKVCLHVHGATFQSSTFERIELQNEERRVLCMLP